jgi:adenylosuccinate synthase
MVMNYHKLLDAAVEDARGSGKVGTTLRGIGPCYRDKAARSGIRAAELVNPASLREVLKRNLDYVNKVMTRVYDREPIDFETTYEKYRELGEKMRPIIGDTVQLLNGYLKDSKKVLFEGAQGCMLDLDFGTYPFLTSSNTTTGGICTGTGVPPKLVGQVTGVLKAYATRVGEGPFPTELFGLQGEKIRDQGGEYGATTGRPRRCGWLDGVVARYAATVNGVDKLAVTKLDVLSGQETIKVCVAYKCDGKRCETVPGDYRMLEKCEPVYEDLPGWNEDISACRNLDELPQAARDYLEYLEKLVDAPIELVSVGSERSQVIYP